MNSLFRVSMAMTLARALLVIAATALVLALLPAPSSCSIFNRNKAEQQACEAGRECAASGSYKPPAAAKATRVPVNKVTHPLKHFVAGHWPVATFLLGQWCLIVVCMRCVNPWFGCA